MYVLYMGGVPDHPFVSKRTIPGQRGALHDLRGKSFWIDGTTAVAHELLRITI